MIDQERREQARQAVGQWDGKDDADLARLLYEHTKSVHWLKFWHNDGKPLLFVMQYPRLLRREAVERLRKEWDDLWKGSPPAPMVVLQDGITLDLIVDPREKSVEGVGEPICVDATPPPH